MRDKSGRFKKGFYSHPSTQFKTGEDSPRKGVKKLGWINRTSFRKKPFTLLWKTNHSEYVKVHRWIVKKKGTPSYCHFCKDTTKIVFEWANVSGRYLRNTKDWMRLCKSCHSLYDHQQAKIFDAVTIITECFRKDWPLLIAGNGGSLSLSEHMAGEFVGKFEIEREPLPAIALSNPSIISAIANDLSFDNIFSRQITAYGRRGCVVFLMTTSDAGKEDKHSANIYNAKQTAKYLKMPVIILGSKKTKMLGYRVNTLIRGRGDNTADIQNNHLEIIHTICRQVEANIFYEKREVENEFV